MMHPRKRYFIHRRFQMDFAIKVLLAVFIPIAICTVFFVAYISIWDAGTRSFGFHVLRGEILRAILVRALPVGFAVVVFSVLFSHRIAGPLKRLQRTCADYAEGESLPRVSLRKRDYFKPLAIKLNYLMEMKSRDASG
jgi:hypothetical protein